ncbi:substrate-binding domain-containing protein [Ruficoccus amylovorans]|uniref:Substrate-binding domain-containing protein n=1 Tax=Ruficoccus amylovorans TaxID=1804625 RepID=A0A842HI56_9BACT|nr:substrate-binding domain-containing protein [Ruficoccus amylovorans]MBC2595234.1 substrate-binding domain-containing protein [Ruficoccus amylovorans]
MTSFEADSTVAANGSAPRPNALSKYEVIYQELQNKILSGTYAVGDRLPSESALVRMYGVSRPTAAKALQELVVSGLIERKAGSGSFVSDKKRTKASERTVPQLGLLMPGLENTEIFEMISGQLASLARNRDYTLVWGGLHGSYGKLNNPEPENTFKLCRQLIERKVNGVFFAPFECSKSKEEINRKVLDELSQAGITVVLLDRDVHAFPRRSNWDLVGIDNLAAGYMMADHLLKLGCRKLCFFTRPYAAPTVDARIAGIREALLRHGVRPEAKWVIEGNPEDPAVIADMMAGNRWDACICGNDRTAAQVLQSLMRRGVRVPGDIRLAGFDDVKYATLIAVPLTTVYQPCDEIATLAFEAMLRRMDNPLAPACSFVATPRLVVRESCGTYTATDRGPA